MTKAELINIIKDLPDDTRVAINVPSIDGDGVWHRDIVECFPIHSKLYNNGVEVHLGTEPFWTKR